MVLIQERLIANVREICHADERLDAAMMYGSFASGEADTHSDVEFWLFFLPQWRDDVDRQAWVAQIAPVRYLAHNEFGTDVMLFPGLVRGEFHFGTTDDIATVRSWPARGAPTDRMIVLDRSGMLRPALEALPERPATPTTGEEAETLCGRFVNWLVLAHHVADRGEVLRAWDALGQAHRHLLWMARLVEGATIHWLTPSRRAEVELPPHIVADLRTTTASADPGEVRNAVRAAWRQGRRYWTQLARLHSRRLPHDLFAELDSAL